MLPLDGVSGLILKWVHPQCYDFGGYLELAGEKNETFIRFAIWIECNKQDNQRDYNFLVIDAHALAPTQGSTTFSSELQ